MAGLGNLVGAMARSGGARTGYSLDDEAKRRAEAQARAQRSHEMEMAARGMNFAREQQKRDIAAANRRLFSQQGMQNYQFEKGLAAQKDASRLQALGGVLGGLGSLGGKFLGPWAESLFY